MISVPIDDILTIEVQHYDYTPAIPAKLTGHPDTWHDGEPESIEVLVWRLLVDGQEAYGSTDLKRNQILAKIPDLYRDEIHNAIKEDYHDNNGIFTDT